MATLTKLFEPFAIRGLKLRNRLAWTAHDTNLAEDHLPSDAHVAYYGARAEGGVGLIVLEANSVHPTAEIHGACVHAYDPRSVDGFRRIADVVHGHGAAAVVQLAHQGTHMTFHKNLTPAWAPSLVPSVVEREMPHVMDRADIAEIVAGYARSASNVVAGGMDGVEVSAAHSYLPAQFLSPWYNRRSDEYGGSPENRRRFLLEVLTATRAAIGDATLGVRISGDELTDFGMKADDAIEVARALEESGLVDYLSVSIGSMHTRNLIVPTMTVRQGYQLPTTERVRRSTRLPVLAIGRIVDPRMAEEVLEAGIADLVGMTRAQIADPELAEKARTGRLDQIRPCIGCNQVCRERFFLGKPISCTVNPVAGREAKLGAVRPSGGATILVVGGGPAGLHAAVALAGRGHAVELHERGDRLGGQALLAAALPGRAEIASSVAHLEAECARLGVDVRLESEVSSGTAAELGADAVIVATGSRPRTPPLPEYALGGLDEAGAPALYTLWQAVIEPLPARHLLVIDEMGRYEGLGVAELLRERGHQVTVCTSLGIAAPRLLPTGDHSLIVTRLLDAGVDIHAAHRVLRAEAGTVTLVHTLSARLQVELAGVDGIVLVAGNTACDKLYRELRADGAFAGAVHAIGDCNAPRSLDEAFYEAEIASRLIDGRPRDRGARPTHFETGMR